MKASGKTITFAPPAAASPIRRTALSTQASVSNGIDPACTTATLTAVGFAVVIVSVAQGRPKRPTAPPRGAAKRSKRGGRSSGRPRVAHGEHLPLMPVGLVPIDHPPAIVRVDPAVDRPAYRAPIGYARRLDAREDRVERRVVDAKAEVLDGKLG